MERILLILTVDAMSHLGEEVGVPDMYVPLENTNFFMVSFVGKPLVLLKQTDDNINLLNTSFSLFCKHVHFTVILLTGTMISKYIKLKLTIIRK